MHDLTWVWIHGWGSDSTVWADLLAQLDVPSLCLDLPGFGSQKEQRQESVDALLVQLAEQLPARCLLVGWSLGGMLATRLAEACPDRVKGLITIACNPCFVACADWPVAMAQSTYDRFCQQFSDAPDRTWKRFGALQSQGDDRQRQVCQHLVAPRGLDPSAQVQQWRDALGWLQRLDNRHVLARLRCPQWHIYGGKDEVVPVAVAERMSQRWQIKTSVIPQAAHAPHLSCPELLADQLRRWVAALPSGISKQRITRSFSGSANSYDAAAHVQRRIARHLVQCLPRDRWHGPVLDIGCGTGFVTEQLLNMGAETYAVDLAEAMVRHMREKLPQVRSCVGDGECLPIADECLSAIVSSLALQWCESLTAVFDEAWRTLQPGGLLAFATLGPETLFELKQAWAKVDDYVHVNDFVPAATVVQQLEARGFEKIRYQRYPLTVYYRELMTLLRELKAIGAHNMNSGQRPGLTLRSRLKTLEQAYRQYLSAEGKFPATYDVLVVIVKKVD